jgi:cytochrome b
MRNTRIWDLPTRLFHWGLVICVVGLIITAKFSDGLLHLHAKFGYAALTLLAFRVLWGIVGGHWSRFATFVPTPATLARYLRERMPSGPGHNPLGALSVLAMLAALLLQVFTGMMINDDDEGFTGPLYAHVPGWLADAAGEYHEDIGQGLIFFLLALHVLAIIWHKRRHNPLLIQAMITGDQQVGVDAPPSRDNALTRLFGLALWLACVALVVWWVN